MSSEFRDRAIDWYVDRIAQRRENLALVRSYFGFKSVPVELAKVEELPVNRAVIQKLRPGYVSAKEDIPHTLPALVEIQRRINIDPKRSVSLHAGYAENMSGKRINTFGDAEEEYEKAHTVLTREPKHEMTRMERVMATRAALHMYPNLVNIQQHLVDPAFLASFKETVARMVAYVNETGETLDLVGKNNAVLLKVNDGWELKLPDALPPGDASIAHLKAAANALIEGNEIPRTIISGAMNSMHTLRFINALALVAGIPDRVKMPELAGIPAEDWRREFSQLWSKYKAA